MDRASPLLRVRPITTQFGARTAVRALRHSKGDRMFTLLRMLPWQRILVEQLPALAGAWLIAELFYKFHSFSLETAAFLATWFVFDALIQGLRRLARAGHKAHVQ